MRFICFNCGYAIWKVERIHSPMVFTDYPCPKCGYKNNAAFYPPGRMPKGEKQNESRKTVTRSVGLHTGRSPEGAGVHREPGSEVSPRPDGLGMQTLPDTSPEIVQGRVIRKERLHLPERTEPETGGLQRTGGQAGDKVGGVDLLEPGPQEHEDTDHMGGAHRKPGRGVVYSTRLRQYIAKAARRTRIMRRIS